MAPFVSTTFPDLQLFDNLQSRKALLDAGLHQADAVREKLARGTVEEGRARRPHNGGPVKSHLIQEQGQTAFSPVSSPELPLITLFRYARPLLLVFEIDKAVDTCC